MRRLLGLIATSVTVVILAVASPAAAVTILTGVGDFSGSETLVNFAGTPLTSSTPSLTISGATFTAPASSLQVQTTPASGRSDPEQTAIFGNYGVSSGSYSPIEISFASDINRVGFEARTNTADPITVTASLMLDGSVVDTVTFGNPADTNFFFYGIETTAAFDSLLIDPANNANGVVWIDNVRFENVLAAPVPEPSAALLFGVGFAAVAMRLRRPTA